MRKRSTLFYALEDSRQLYANTDLPPINPMSINPDEYYYIGSKVMGRQKRCYEKEGILDPGEMDNAITTLQIAATEYEKLGQSGKAAGSRQLIEEGQMCLESYMASKVGNKPDRFVPRPPGC